MFRSCVQKFAFGMAPYVLALAADYWETGHEERMYLQVLVGALWRGHTVTIMRGATAAYNHLAILF